MSRVKFKNVSFDDRLTSMLRVDMRRLMRSTLFFILVGSAFLMPILILVMTSMMDGTVSVNPQTGVETVVEGFDNVWQIIGTLSSSGTESDPSAAMSLTSMCNINMLYFLMAAFVCIFVSDEFRSGYAKNLFTVRASKTDYVISKTMVCALGCAAMLVAFFIGALLGGAICRGMTGLSMDMVGFGAGQLVMCMLSKIALVGVFVPIYLAIAVAAKQRAWLSILLSMSGGMLLFMMIPMLTPLDASLMNVLLCLAGGVMFSVGLGAVSKLVLDKTSLV